jgi:hypothetical protein
MNLSKENFAASASSEPREANSAGEHHIPKESTRISLNKPSPELVREQLVTLLASPRLSGSPRCQSLLRHVVESTLSGNADSLKERNIGVEILKRDPDYDTGSDPAVRVAASELRKKLAQYYFETEDQSQVRIGLPTGSYVPVFSFHEPARAHDVALRVPEIAPLGFEGALREPELTVADGSKVRLRMRGAFLLALFACVLIAVAAVSIWQKTEVKSPFELFWAPVLQSSKSVLICAGQLRATRVELDPVNSRNPSGWKMPLGPGGIYPKNLSVVAINDAIAMANIAALLSNQKRQFTVQGEAGTTYEDLQKGPSVLLGAFNNDWSLYLTRNLRFHFLQNTDGFQWIEDQKDPSGKIGLQKTDEDTFGPTEYGLIARVTDPETKQPVVVLAGVTPVGTIAAGQFITNPQLLSESLKALPVGWESKNVELLFSVNVVENEPGTPHIAGFDVW